MSILFSLICRFNVILIKISASLYVDIDNWILKFIWKGEGTKRAKINSKKKKVKMEDSHYPITVWYC